MYPMPRSNSSRGLADGGNVVSAAPVARGAAAATAGGGLRALPVLARSSGRDTGLDGARLAGGAGLGGGGGLSTGSSLRAALNHSQALFELPVAIVQLLVLAGELTQPVLELLNSHFRIVGLR